MSNLIQCRAYPDLLEAFEDFREKHGLPKGEAVRILLSAALGEPSKRALANELAFQTVATQKRAMAQVGEILQRELPRILDEELGS